MQQKTDYWHCLLRPPLSRVGRLLIITLAALAKVAP